MRLSTYSIIAARFGTEMPDTAISPEWIFFVAIFTRVMAPSMPKPPIAAWNRSGRDSRLTVWNSPFGRTMSISRIASPMVPTL